MQEAIVLNDIELLTANPAGINDDCTFDLHLSINKDLNNVSWSIEYIIDLANSSLWSNQNDIANLSLSSNQKDIANLSLSNNQNDIATYHDKVIDNIALMKEQEEFIKANPNYKKTLNIEKNYLIFQIY